jgi:hypothetical protein
MGAVRRKEGVWEGKIRKVKERRKEEAGGGERADVR